MNRKRPGLCGQVPTNENVTNRIHYLVTVAGSFNREKQNEAYEDFGRALAALTSLVQRSMRYENPRDEALHAYVVEIPPGEHYDYDGIVVAEIKTGSLR